MRDKVTAMENTAKKRNVHIQSYSIFKDIMAVCLVTKELRIMRLKKYFFNKVITEELYSKFYHEPPLFVHIFESKIQLGQMFILYAVESDNEVEVRVKRFIESEGLLSTVYSHTLKYFPIFEVVEHLGVAIFNERGMFNFLELNSLHSKDLMQMKHSVQLFNPTTEKKMPISVVRYHRTTMRLVAGCLDGFVYSLSYADLELKRLRRLTNKPVTGIELDERQNFIMVLCSDNRARLLHGDTLEVFNVVDLAESGIQAIRGLYAQGEDWFYVYGQNLAKVTIRMDSDKISKMHRAKCTHKERVKMFTDDAKDGGNAAESDTVTKVWVSYEILVILFDSGCVHVLLGNL